MSRKEIKKTAFHSPEINWKLREVTVKEIESQQANRRAILQSSPSYVFRASIVPFIVMALMQAVIGPLYSGGWIKQALIAIVFWMVVRIRTAEMAQKYDITSDELNTLSVEKLTTQKEDIQKKIVEAKRTQQRHLGYISLLPFIIPSYKWLMDQGAEYLIQGCSEKLGIIDTLSQTIKKDSDLLAIWGKESLNKIGKLLEQQAKWPPGNKHMHWVRLEQLTYKVYKIFNTNNTILTDPNVINIIEIKQISGLVKQLALANSRGVIAVFLIPFFMIMPFYDLTSSLNMLAVLQCYFQIALGWYKDRKLNQAMKEQLSILNQAVPSIFQSELAWSQGRDFCHEFTLDTDKLKISLNDGKLKYNLQTKFYLPDLTHWLRQHCRMAVNDDDSLVIIEPAFKAINISLLQQKMLAIIRARALIHYGAFEQQRFLKRILDTVRLNPCVEFRDDIPTLIFISEGPVNLLDFNACKNTLIARGFNADAIQRTPQDHLLIMGVSLNFIENLRQELQVPVTSLGESKTSARSTDDSRESDESKRSKIKTQRREPHIPSDEGSEEDKELSYTWTVDNRLVHCKMSPQAVCEGEVFAVEDSKRGLYRFFILSAALQYAVEHQTLKEQQLRLIAGLRQFRMVGEHGNGIKRVSKSEELRDIRGNPAVYKAKMSSMDWRLLAAPVAYATSPGTSLLYEFNKFARH